MFLKEDTKERYKAFCLKNPDIPLFFNPQWLDAVSDGEDWDVLFHENNGVILAVFPFQIKRRYGMNILSLPKLTPYTGIWYNLPDEELKRQKINSLIKNYTQEILNALPRFHYFQIGFHPQFKDWQPFLWQGFYQRTRYTYRLKTNPSREELWENLNPKIRNHIRKAKEKLVVKENNDPSAFFLMSVETFKRQNMDVPYQRKILDNIFNTFSPIGQCEIHTAYDKDGRPQASMMIVCDNHVSYCIGTGKAIEAERGAVPLLTWHAILRAKSRRQIFDFEGSDIQTIEKFYRNFGGKLTSYHQIYKSRYRWLDALFFFIGRFR